MRMDGDRIYIKLLRADDAEEVLALHLKNREFFKKFITTRDDEFYTLKKQEEIIEVSIAGSEKDEKYSYGIFLRDNNKLIGNITLSEILRHAFQSCYVGYYLDEEHNGKGYMSEAVKLVVKYALEELKLHRIEAGVMPRNARSMRVLEKAGFKKEGIARKNVQINGVWEDHQLLAIIAEDLGV